MSNDQPPPEAPPAPDPLLEKLLKASKDAKAVAKSGENKAQGYNYARAEDVIAEARRALHKAGLVAVIDFTVEGAKEIKSSSGTGGLFVRVAAVLRVLDPESGRGMTVAGIGTGSDYPGDKAPYKAMTGAAKYLYASTLGIPFGDDPEDDATGGGQASAPTSSPQSEPAGPPRGFSDRAQRDAFRSAVGAAARSDAEMLAIESAAARSLTAEQISNAGSQLLGEHRARAVANLRRLAGLEPLDLSVPDTRDLPPAEPEPVEAVEGEVADPGPDPVEPELFPDEPTDADERL
jgi:ERF superfamily